MHSYAVQGPQDFVGFSVLGFRDLDQRRPDGSRNTGCGAMISTFAGVQARKSKGELTTDAALHANGHGLGWVGCRVLTVLIFLKFSQQARLTL